MKYTKFIFAFLILLAAAVAAFSYWTYSSLSAPHSHDKSETYIKIEKGSTPNQIIEKLSDEGILSAKLPLKIYVRTVGSSSKFQAGEYKFASPITPLEVLNELAKGEERTVKLTIPEGFTRFDIAARIAENFPQEPPVSETDILNLMNDTSLIREFDPDAGNLEGYLYPSTYNIAPDAAPASIVKTMVEQFKKTWKPEWTVRARELGRTNREIVTIASLIETESKFEEERRVVSSVIYNRINRNIPLGIDQTAVYIAKMQNRWDGVINKSDLEVDSPYNTRKYGGIPPGPISSPSASAIEAALYPDQTDYIFYVLNVGKNDGSHAFFNNARDFERAKAAYQSWLAEERKKVKRSESQ
ncbi:MAG: endolytic transglycosylase MltG [Pyrinomonadaceae bacterium]|nr:endolytic transglycosylase MltG [Pyrinomonadaceae bacterium]